MVCPLVTVCMVIVLTLRVLLNSEVEVARITAHAGHSMKITRSERWRAGIYFLLFIGFLGFALSPIGQAIDESIGVIGAYIGLTLILIASIIALHAWWKRQIGAEIKDQPWKKRMDSVLKFLTYLWPF
jgi:hypothetical protein